MADLLLLMTVLLIIAALAELARRLDRRPDGRGER